MSFPKEWQNSKQPASAGASAPAAVLLASTSSRAEPGADEHKKQIEMHNFNQYPSRGSRTAAMKLNTQGGATASPAGPWHSLSKTPCTYVADAATSVRPKFVLNCRSRAMACSSFCAAVRPCPKREGADMRYKPSTDRQPDPACGIIFCQHFLLVLVFFGTFEYHQQSCTAGARLHCLLSQGLGVCKLSRKCTATLPNSLACHPTQLTHGHSFGFLLQSLHLEPPFLLQGCTFQPAVRQLRFSCQSDVQSPALGWFPWR